MMWETGAMKNGKRKRWIILGIVATILIAGLVLLTNTLGGLRDSRAAGQTDADDVVVAFLGDVSATVSASGHVESVQVTQLSVDPPGIVESVHVQAGDEVQAGDVLVKLETDDLALKAKRAAQNLALSETKLEALQNGPNAEDVAAAEAAVLSAQVNLDNLLAGPTEQDIVSSEADVRAQEANVASASAAYRGTLDSISGSAIAAAEADVVEAQIAYEQAKKANEEFSWVTTYDAMVDAAEDLEIAQAALDELLAGPNQGKVASAAASVSAAEANVDQAAANHEQLLSGASESQIAAAKANLAQTQANLASLTAGASTEAITVAEAKVTRSRLALADAQEVLTKATITAPFDGIVTGVYVAEGEYTVGAVAELASSELYVLLNVDEVDIGGLAVGQPTIVTLETWPDVEIAGEITSIAPSANPGGDGIVSFDVRLSLRHTDLPVLVGMTADAQLITTEHENVLLVPNAALTADRLAGTYTVNLVTGEADGEPIAQELQVTLGLRDDNFSEITSGLAKGDQVLIGELKAPTQSFGPFGGR
jgi:HlyD family secretion protein